MTWILATGDPVLVAVILPLAVGFTWWAAAVTRLVRRTEDDELLDRINQGAPDGDLQLWLAELQVPELRHDDIPVRDLLAAWDRGEP